MNERFNDVLEILQRYGQEHLINFTDEISPEGQKKLIEGIMAIDFDLMARLFKKASGREKHSNDYEIAIESIESEVLDEFDDEALRKFELIGEEKIRLGKVAAVTMAGGQGTRLGHNGPKGTFNIGVSKEKSLFQIQAERLITLSGKLESQIPWYIMTSGENNRDTIEYFITHDYFGYSKKDIFFFTQGMLPIVDTEGRVLLKEKDEIYMGPDGNGGVFLSLKKSGALEDMEKRGVEWVFICGIDNALVKMAEPVFIGHTIMTGKPASSKSVAKKYPDERVGVFCRRNEKPFIVEYTELPPEYRVMTRQDGSLVYGDANIISHIFSIDALISISDKGLPYHTAFKRIPYIGEDGKKADPESPNAYKFESFIFDAFQFLEDMTILRVSREREFAPVKNRTGEDSPETARELLRLNGMEI